MAARGGVACTAEQRWWTESHLSYNDAVFLGKMTGRELRWWREWIWEIVQEKRWDLAMASQWDDMRGREGRKWHRACISVSQSEAPWWKGWWVCDRGSKKDERPCSYVSNLTEQISLLGFLELSQCIWSIRKDQCSLYPFLCGMSTYVLFSQIRCIFTLTSLLLSGRVVTKSCIVTFVRCSHSAGGLVFTDSRRQTGPFPAVWENQALISDTVVMAHSTEYGWRQQIPQSTWLLVTEGRAFNTCSFWNLKIWFQITFK